VKHKKSSYGKWRAIINPTANCGRGREAALPFLLELKESSVEIHVEETICSGHATTLAQEAVEKSFSGVIAFGGDGTASETANGLIRSPIPMITVPIGRGNDFVKSSGNPNDPKELISFIMDGKNKSVDTIKIDNIGYAINGVSIDDFATTVSQHVGSGFLAYIKPALHYLSAYKDKLYQVSFDDSTLAENRFLVFVIMNGKIAGKDFLFTPEAKIDDGLLDVCLIKQVPSRFARLCYLVAVMANGKHTRLRATEMKKAEKISIVIPELSSIDLQIDGEHKKIETNVLNISIAPRSLVIRVP